MKTPHLAATVMALVLTAVALFGFLAYAQWDEAQYVHALAPRHVALNVTGSALQKAAFKQTDLLPIYGASEVLNQPSAYQPATFFQNYPTGFETFEVARGGVQSIIVAEALAAIGPDLNGKKIVISYTPAQFTSKMMGASAYAGLFSGLHANELAFSPLLSFATKQMAAKRMLQYPATLAHDPVLRFSLEQLASGTPLGRALYTAVWPLGRLQTFILELQDHFATISYIQSQRTLDPTVKRQPAAINWPALDAKAKKEQIPHANNNPYGFDNTTWKGRFSKFKARPAASGDARFVATMDSSAEWTDFELVLRILTELGAQPLVVGRPMPGFYNDAAGISAKGRQAFYARLNQTADHYGVPVVDLHEYEYDKYFGVDPAPHTSREGWAYVDQVLDAYYHGTLQ